MTNPATNSDSQIAPPSAIRIERDGSLVAGHSDLASHASADFAADGVVTAKTGLLSPSILQKFDSREKQASDYQIAFEGPTPLPITDKELRAIEVLLGRELQELLSDNANEH